MFGRVVGNLVVRFVGDLGSYTVFSVIEKRRSYCSSSISHNIRAFYLQGNCTSDPTEEFYASVWGDAPVLPRRPGMCMLLTPQDVLYHRSENLWLENLYLRVSRNESTVEAPLTLLSVSDPTFQSQLWITDSMLQGDGGLTVNGLTVSSRAYAGGAYL